MTKALYGQVELEWQGLHDVLLLNFIEHEANGLPVEAHQSNDSHDDYGTSDHEGYHHEIEVHCLSRALESLFSSLP